MILNATFYFIIIITIYLSIYLFIYQLLSQY